MKITEHNATTGEVIIRDMSPSEATQYEKDQGERAARIAKLEADATVKEALLKRLGISADEAALLLG
jgi:competence protein ComGC